VRVGCLAVQGSYREHLTALARIPGVQAIEVRTKEELNACQGLIIPGGESTTMALVCERWGLVDELRSFAGRGRPVWGTCAGMIFLASGAHNAKEGGQALLGGLPVTVSRNFFGAQINSFECDLEAPATLPDAGAGPCRALFIRAPAILDASDGVDVLARYHLTEAERAKYGRDNVIVAVRKGHLLATAFHPELTDDTRWHKMFVQMVREVAKGEPLPPFAPRQGLMRNVMDYRPRDVPVYGKDNPFRSM